MTIIAHKTITAIENSLEKDQGAGYRKALEKLLPKMSDAYSGESDDFRSHFGYSTAGEKCSKKLWLSWRWVKASKFKGKVLRLFNRGHLEEARFLALLVSTGFEIHYETPEGGQFRIEDHDGHAGSAIDGVVVGIPDLPPNEPALTEMKTHNYKNFSELCRKGVEEGFWKHYVQMQIYMKYYNLKWALYLAINKNTDELYGEIIPYDEVTANRYVERSGEIIYTEVCPPKISDSPGWYECKFCDYLKICHFKEIPAINCRTCIHSVPSRKNKAWHCTRFNEELNKKQQLAGCADHLYNTELLNEVQIHRKNLDEGWINISWHGQGVVLGNKEGQKCLTSQQLKDKNV